LDTIHQSILDQLPPLPSHEAQWRAIYMEPVMGSGERITVAVIAFDQDGCDALKTLSPSRLRALFGKAGIGMSSMINLVVDSALRQGQSGHLDNFKSPLSGVYLGELRNGLSESRIGVLRQAASLTSCFFERN
jgi:hypothetical protein